MMFTSLLWHYQLRFSTRVGLQLFQHASHRQSRGHADPPAALESSSRGQLPALCQRPDPRQCLRGAPRHALRAPAADRASEASAAGVMEDFLSMRSVSPAEIRTFCVWRNAHVLRGNLRDRSQHPGLSSPDSNWSCRPCASSAIAPRPAWRATTAPLSRAGFVAAHTRTMRLRPSCRPWSSSRSGTTHALPRHRRASLPKERTGQRSLPATGLLPPGLHRQRRGGQAGGSEPSPAHPTPPHSPATVAGRVEDLVGHCLDGESLWAFRERGRLTWPRRSSKL